MLSSSRAPEQSLTKAFPSNLPTDWASLVCDLLVFVGKIQQAADIAKERQDIEVGWNLWKENKNLVEGASFNGPLSREITLSPGLTDFDSLIIIVSLKLHIINKQPEVVLL